MLVIEKGSYNHDPVVGDRNAYEQLYYGGSYFSTRRGFLTMSCASTLGGKITKKCKKGQIDAHHVIYATCLGGSTIAFGACVKVSLCHEQCTRQNVDASSQFLTHIHVFFFTNVIDASICLARVAPTNQQGF